LTFSPVINRKCFVFVCPTHISPTTSAIQNRLIHRESRDEPEKYRATVASSLCRPSGHDQSNDSEPTEEGTDIILLLMETLIGLQLSQRPLAESATDPKFPPRTEHFGQAGVCWQCGSQYHNRRDCSRLPLHTREFLQEFAGCFKQPPTSESETTLSVVNVPPHPSL
jgi:hypothetical protein